MTRARHHMRRRREHGFTLIEMIVVLILLALAMAAIYPAIGNMLRSNSRGASSSQATGEAGIAARLLESDVRAALGNRGTGERVATSTTALGTTVATIPALNMRNASVSDIVTAGPRQLYFNADVYPDAGVERVEWELLLNNAACGDRDRISNSNFCLQRRVRAPGGGALLTVETVVRGRGAYPTGTRTCGSDMPRPGNPLGAVPVINTPRVFCYMEATPDNGALNDYVWNAGWSANCVMRWDATTPGTSPNTASITVTSNTTRIPTTHNAVDGVTAISRVDRIVTVGAAILSGGGFGKSSERSYENVEIVIRARESEAYREAIMCGTRAGWGR